MSDLIAFLERMGSQAQLRNASPDALATAMDEAGLDDATRTAVSRGDSSTLVVLAGARPVMRCAFAPKDNEPGKQPDDEPKDDDEIRVLGRDRADDRRH